MFKILVTGASGFLGSHLCPRLKMEGHDLTCLDSKMCDLTKEGSLNQFSTHRFDRIYHLATWTQAGDFCLRHPGEQWLINQRMNTSLLEWWKDVQPQAKLVCMGTSCGYDPTIPLEESNYLQGRPIDSLLTFAMTKRVLYSGLLAFNKQFGLNYLHVIPTTLYGPGYHKEGKQMHFIFDLIRKIINGKKRGDPVVLWGDGYQKRELAYVKDFVENLLKLDQQETNISVNFGGGEERTIRDFAQIICDEVGYDFNQITFDTTKYVGAKAKFLNIELAKSLLPDYSQTPLNQGLRETIRWFASAY